VRKRAVSGPIAYNQTRFPSGIAALADYVHGKGAPLRRIASRRSIAPGRAG